MKSVQRKRRTRQHIIADLGVNFVERQVLLAGYTAQRIYADYGIDLEVTTFNKKGEIDEGKVLFQVKATEVMKISPRGTFGRRIARKDLLMYLAQPIPVIVAFYEAKKDVAYWLYVQSYFRTLQNFNIFAVGETITIQVPETNLLGPTAMEKFARFRDRLYAQIGGLIHAEDED